MQARVQRVKRELEEILDDDADMQVGKRGLVASATRCRCGWWEVLLALPDRSWEGRGARCFCESCDADAKCRRAGVVGAAGMAAVPAAAALLALSLSALHGVQPIRDNRHKHTRSTQRSSHVNPPPPPPSSTTLQDMYLARRAMMLGEEPPPDRVEVQQHGMGGRSQARPSGAGWWGRGGWPAGGDFKRREMRMQ